VYDQKGMMQIAVDFYKILFAKEPESGVNLGSDFWGRKIKSPEKKMFFLLHLLLRPK
jgi:hypothetical protein